MNPQLHLRIAGALLIALAGAHVTFPRRFKWREEMARVSLLNRQMFFVHIFFICLGLAMNGALALFWTNALLEKSALAAVVLGCITLFWFLRLLVQLFVYDSSLWRGNRFNTCMHVVFSLFWTYLMCTFGGALIRGVGF